MKYLAATHRHITVLLEILRQRDRARRDASKIIVVVENLSFGRVMTGQKRCSRRVANRILSVRPVKAHAPGCELIDIRRFDAFYTVSSKLWPQVVRNDKKHVVSLFGFISLGYPRHCGYLKGCKQNARDPESRKLFFERDVHKPADVKIFDQ